MCPAPRSFNGYTIGNLITGVALAGGRGLRAVALCDNVPLLTAVANDERSLPNISRFLPSPAMYS